MRARSNQVRTSGVVPRSSAGALLLGLALAASGGCTAGGSTGTSTGNPNDGTNNVPSLPGGGGRDTPIPGGDLGGEDGLATGGFCKADKNVLESTSTQTELGFSADDVLAFAAGAHEEAIVGFGMSFRPTSGQGRRDGAGHGHGQVYGDGSRAWEWERASGSRN